jgi:hypothetical protein
VQNPVISAKNVNDVPAEFVADPFMLEVGGIWYMFFEVMNTATEKGEIGLATSHDGLRWHYRQIVLCEPFHLSFPCVFRWNNDVYMVPESHLAGAIRLYRAIVFPLQWEFVKTLRSGKYVDSSIFVFAGRWWLFTCPDPQKHSVLELFHADSPLEDWTPHACNAIVCADSRIARPGGRVLADGKRLIRFAQDCCPRYGRQVRAFHISELTPNAYEEEEAHESPILTPTGTGWNANAMHQIDVHAAGDQQWIACVDGHGIIADAMEPENL